MNVKELLEAHKRIDDEIELGLEEIAQLRALAEKVTQRLSLDTSFAKGTYTDRTGDYAVKIADLEIKIDRKIDKLVDLREQILKMIGALENNTERILIERRYILHESTEVIAEKLNYSPRHTARLLQKALEDLEEIYEKSEKIAS